MAVALVPGELSQGATTHPGSLRLQVLGPLRVWRGSTELDPGPRQQAYLLALLLARGGRPVGTSELIEMIWGENAPATALNVIHKYVGSLRRLLEPDLPPRRSGAYLVRWTTGYLCAAGPDVLDLARFRQLVASARSARSTSRESALDQYVAALELWSGPAGDGSSHEPQAVPVFAGLNEEFFQAGIEAGELATALGQAGRVLPALHLASEMAPLHEPVQAGLIVSLGAAGHQAEALTTFDRVRRRLADDLGIDPGVALRAAQRRVLEQREAVVLETEPRVAGPETSPAPDGLVGRADEVAALRRAVAPAFADATAVVLLEGEPGAGKTRLLEEVARDAAKRGARVVWGHCLDGTGAPTMWPWVEVVEALLKGAPGDRREEWLGSALGDLLGARDGPVAAPTLPGGHARLRLQEDVIGLVSEAASERPLVVVLDDLQWADASTLRLFDHLVARMPRRTAVLGALRNQCPPPGDELARALAAASRVPGHRRRLVPARGEPDVAELVRRESGTAPSAEVARQVHVRTAGNPFLVREVARLLTDSPSLTGESVLSSGVPVTVRDVVGSRLAGLDPSARELLETAALVGRRVELVLLARAASLDVASCLDRLEPARSLGLLGPARGDPFAYRFVHDLFREAVAEAIPPGRAAALHGRIADAIEHSGLDDGSMAERAAHHLWAAGPVIDPARTVSTLLRAAHRATAKSALREAERHLLHAVAVARAAALPEHELDALSSLVAVAGMRSMYGAVPVQVLDRAEQVALALGREREAAGFLFSRWTAHVQGLDLQRSCPLADLLWERGSCSTDPVVRTYGRAAWGIQQWHLGHIGESFRRLEELDGGPQHHGAAEDHDPVRAGLRLLTTAMLAEISVYHGQEARARSMLDGLSAAAGDDPYAVTVAASLAARAGAVAGDPAWALAAADRGIAVDPQFSFAFLGTYLRLARCWALAMSGRDPARWADDAERLLLAHLVDPVRSCVSTWFALLAEMRLAAGAPDAAAAALDRAESLRDRHGQRTADGLILLVRAQVARACGDRDGAARLALRARATGRRQEAHLFVRRADRLLEELGPPRLHLSSTARA